MKVLIVGASRGIGLEFVRQYRAAGVAVTATALALDVADAVNASGLASQIDGKAFDWRP